MTETYAPPDPDPRSKLFSPKGFEAKPQPKLESKAVAPDDDIVKAVAAAAKYLGIADRDSFADGIWGDSKIELTDKQRHILRTHEPKEPADSEQQ